MLYIVEKALLVKLYYNNSESAIATLQPYRYMKGMRDSKGRITPSSLTKTLNKFEATGSLASRQRSGRPSTTVAVAATVEQTVDIAERHNRNVSNVHYCWKQRPRDGTASRRSGFGWSHGTTDRDDHSIRRTPVTHRAASVAVGTTVIQRTARNCLVQRLLRTRLNVVCIPLTRSHCCLRR
ncbi:uncharacterized protein TNCV_4799741 [Trichonephila clavipes]|uniref:DUF4817 domain-containing protein n=1 Tax=Trichonephila clavipes TaxID=2585209 RepID=A0A8X6V4G4_TRICX|nr:uncharacterized protein TNCV_4799741 [Trichonephila clavipes]